VNDTEARKSKGVEENPFQSQCVYLIFHMTWPGIKYHPLHWEADDQELESWLAVSLFVGAQLSGIGCS